MSTDVIALFDRSDIVTAEWLLAWLKTNSDFASEVTDEYRDLWLVKAWTIEPSGVRGEPELFGPGGFAIRLEPATVELYHTMHFRTFTHHEASRDALRYALREIADLVGSARAIITHELMPYAGAGLIAIEHGLRAKIGPPAATFDELREAAHYGPRAWYIDTFADLRRSGAP
jgi:hypothetical protein